MIEQGRGLSAQVHVSIKSVPENLPWGQERGQAGVQQCCLEQSPGDEGWG